MEGNQHNSEKEEGELSSDDDYQSKLSEMQTYIPFLQQMIQRLEQSNDRSREAQLSKMKSLYGILSNTKKKLKVETLKRCEDVLRNLMNKVEKSTGHKEVGKVKKKSSRELSYYAKNPGILESSRSHAHDHRTTHFKHSSESDDSRNVDKMSDHEAVVSSTTQSCDTENPLTDVVKALKLAAARNNLRNKLENVKTAMHSPGHTDDIKGNVSSSSPPHQVSSTSPVRQNFQERNDSYAKEGLEQSRERLKKLMGHHLTATPSPPYQSPSETHYRTLERSVSDTASPKTDWPKDNTWEQFSSIHSVSSDSCDNELFTRRDGWNTEKNKGAVQNVNYNPRREEGCSKSESNSRTFDKMTSPKSDTLLKSPSRSIKSLVHNSSPTSKVFSPDRGDESDKSDGGSGARSVRAKLEQEIHKVHRVGVSTGGALRSLVTKDDRNKSINKGKSDDEKSPRKISEPFEKSLIDGERHISERLNKSDEKQVDPRRHPSIDRSPSPSKSKGCVENVLARKKPSPKIQKSDNVKVGGDGKEGAQMFTGMSHEELQRIVSENLRNLPSPPPITKEILENVKISPKINSNTTPNPSFKSFPQTSKLPSTPASPDEVFQPVVNYPQQDMYYGGLQQQFGTVRHGLLDDPKPNMENHQMVDNTRLNLSHCNTDQTVHNVYGSQLEDRQGFSHHEYDARSSFSNPQVLENMRMSGVHCIADDPRSVARSHVVDNSRDRNNENTRYKVPLLEDPRSGHSHCMDDPRMNMPQSYRDDSRRDHHHNIEDTRVSGERRRGLLPTPPRYEKYNYMSSSVNSRGIVQDISSRFDQRTHVSDGRSNSLMSPECQNWDTSHWGNTTAYAPAQNVDRYQQQMYHVRDSRGQINMTSDEQFSPTGHSQSYQWGSNESHNTQQSSMHSSYIANYQPQTRVEHHMQDHNQSKPRVQHADPRLHKTEHSEVSPDPRSADPRLTHVDPRHSAQYSGSRQNISVTGITRLASVSDRDPRRRSIEESDTSRKSMQEQDDKKKRHPDSWRSGFSSIRSDTYKKNDRDKKRTGTLELARNREENKNISKKDTPALSSPLDCLYGTTAVPKTGKGYGFQNFRIPKIRRDSRDTPIWPRPPTPPRPAPPKEKFDEDINEQNTEEQQKKLDSIQHSTDDKKEEEVVTSERKESDSQTKEVTQELIEALIRKSFESGEGKKLFEHAQFFEKLSESLKAKKFRKIKRILESDSEDSDSDNNTSKGKKEGKEEEKASNEKHSKSKTRVIIVSDSDDEPLAEKLEAKVKNADDVERRSDNDQSENPNTSSENLDTSKEVEVEATKDVNKDSGQADTEVVKPVKKPAAKRRNALELLQQDVRDMFIREGVVTATGYRMCRLLKEVQCGASLEEITKNEAKRMEDEADGESDSSSVVSKNDKKGKGKSQTKKKPVSGSKTGKKLGKNIPDVFSDSDNATVSGIGKKKTKRNRYAAEESDSDSSVNTCRTSRAKSIGIRTMEPDRENMRRRGTPRVILEKTDLSKFYSSVSKCNIDSGEESGDELFESCDSKKKHILKRPSVKKGYGKKGGKKLAGSFSDEFFEKEPYMLKKKKLKKSNPFLNKSLNDSIRKLHKFGIPNVSLSELFVPGDILSEKKYKSDTSVKEESKNIMSDNGDDVEEKRDSASLLDRLHGSFSDLTDDMDKKLSSDMYSIQNEQKKTLCEVPDGSTVDLVTNMDVKDNTLLLDSRKENTADNDISRVVSPKSSIKLNLVKRKSTQRKKKCSKWQLGIIKKKSTHKVKMEVESIAGKEEDKDHLNDQCSVDGSNIDVNEDQEGDYSIASDRENRQDDDDDADDDDNDDDDYDDMQYGENSSEVKRNQKEERCLEKEQKSAEKSASETPNFVDIDYAFHSEAKQTSCLLCSYEGKTIVQHYKQVHPDDEVLISRLPLDEACRATTESEEKGYSETSFKGEIAGIRKGSTTFYCRFCNYKVQFAVNFYEHTSSHTGEYRYQCCKCPYMSASRTTFKGHFYNHHPKNKLKQGLNLKVLTEGPSNNVKFIFGYLCSKCNFVQLIRENIEKHILLRHCDDKEVKAIRISMSKPSPVESVEILDEAESNVDTSEIISDDETYADADNAEESFEREDKSKISDILRITVPPVAGENKETKSDNDHVKKSRVKPEDHDKKLTLMEAFVPISTEVDNNECVILAERVKRMQEVIEIVNFSSVLTELQDKSHEDSDIIILLEMKLHNIKQEMDINMEVTECEKGKDLVVKSVTGSTDSIDDDSCITKQTFLTKEKIMKREGIPEDIKNSDQETENLSLQSDNAVDCEIQNDDNYDEVSCEGKLTARPPTPSDKESMLSQSSDSRHPDLEIQDASLERKAKFAQRRMSDVTTDTTKLRSVTCKLTNTDEVNERRITRSLSKTDEDGRSILSDDSGCETSNFEVIEITDESDVGEEELDLEMVITDAKSLQTDVDEGVSLKKESLIERLTKHIVSKEKVVPVYEKGISIVKQERKDVDTVKPPPVAISLNKQSIQEKISIVKPSAVVHVASLEAQLCSNQSILFSCLVPCCVFTTTDALLMEKHLARSHKPNWWDGVCSVCDKRVYGDNFLKGSPPEHKYPLSFALDHLRTVHLNNLSLSEDLQHSCLTTDADESNNTPVNTDAWSSDSSNALQVLGEDTLFNNLGIGNVLSEVEESDCNKVKTPCQYIRTRRLSGDKLSGPSTSQNQVSGTSDTSCDSFMNLVSESDSNILTNDAGDDDLPFLKIESVVSLHPSASSDQINSFMDHSISDPSVSSPGKEASNSPTSNLGEASPLASNLSQPSIVFTGPVNTQVHLVPLSPIRGPVGMAPSTLPSTNIPQPLVNLAQLIRPVTRVITSKENTSGASSVQYSTTKTKKSVVWSGNTSLPTILPKPVTQAYIITSPGKPVSPTVVIPPNIVASSSLATPNIVLPSLSATQSPVLKTISVLRPVTALRGSGSNISVAKKQVKSSAVFSSNSSARTSYFYYKRQEEPRPPLKNTRQILVHKKCKTFEQAKASKSSGVYQSMLIHDKLRQLFKCMAKHCTFTSDSPTFFEEHCWNHVHLYHRVKLLGTSGAGEITENADSSSIPVPDDSESEVRRKIDFGLWPQCCYCCTLHDSPRALNVHVQEEHGQCLYQCAYCFFRAVTYSYVVLHQNTSHTNMRITVLLSRKIPDLLPPVIVKRPRAEVVLPYICNQGDCGLMFWNPAAFWRHLENAHGNMTCFVCHMCVGQYMKPEKLLMHYKLHCHCVYQCQYCLHGSDTKEDMQHHLCNFHPNQKATVIMRDSDPNMPATGFEEEEKSIDQLDVIDLDEGLREDSIIFPPVPSSEYQETISCFWKHNKALLDEYPGINTFDETLLSPIPVEVTITCLLPGTSNNVLDTSGNLVSPLQISSGNLDKRSDGIDSPCKESETNKNNAPEINSPGPTDKTEVLHSPDVILSATNSDKQSTVKTASEKEKVDDCDVIIIDEFSDGDKECSSSESDIKEVPISHVEPPCNDDDNDDVDSDIMIIGSDEEAAPPKKQKLDYNFQFSEFDPNYEPIVTLRHRNLESKARIESATDPLAPDTNQNEILPSQESSCESPNINETSNSAKTCPSTTYFESNTFGNNVTVQDSSEITVLSSKTNHSDRESDLGPEKTENSVCKGLQNETLPCDNKEKEQEQQNQQSVEKGKVECSLTGKESAIDPDILTQSFITNEELEKTGVSGERLYRCGNVTCTYAAPTSNQLRDHLIICDLSRESAGLTCVHCQRPFKQITPYLEHLKHHGTCRYGCFMCKFRAPLPQQVIKHLKQKHRIYNSIILPLNHQNTDSETALFVVCSKDKTRPKIVPHFRNKRFFNPDEVNFLPLKYISYHPLTCSVCNFRSKVVNNMRRHLNFHNNKSMDPSHIPISDPVNPVPCLEKKEMMFDKMTNLAASSHPLGRMGGKTAVSCAAAGGSVEQITLPKFVPENERYVCGSPGCNYLTCDESMLRYHLRALHCDEASYRCPHCPESMQKDLNGLAISVDRMGAHLKMHDSRLYKCTHCTYFHFQRHVVERHLTDKHPEKRPFVQVVREENEISHTSKSEEILSLDENNSLVSNPSTWMCGLCKERFVTRPELYEHTASIHNVKSQYKCSLCTFRSSSKPNSEAHFASRHPGMEVNLITVFQRVVVNPSHSLLPASGNNTTVDGPSKRFDTTPLWLRNMARIRHIRGVLLEDEEETRMHLQKIEENVAPKKPKIKDSAPTPSSSRAASPEPEEPDQLEQKFAPYGKPVMGNMFFCTLCNKYKTRFKQDMKDHLYRELNYVKWMCKHCNLTSCSRHQMQKHSRIHERENKPERIIALQPDIDTELWVDRLLTKQHRDMKGVPDVLPSKSIMCAINKNKNSPLSSPSSSCKTSLSALKSTATTPTSKASTPQKVMNLRDGETSEDEVSLISERQSSQKRKLAAMVARDLEDFEETPLKKTSLSDDKVEDRNGSEIETKTVKKESAPANEDQSVSVAVPEPAIPKKYRCKDCKALFHVVRGLKLHVRLVHLRLGSYSCGYCDRQAYSEISIKHHCKSQHRGRPELINYNEGASNVKLDEEFWEREYGIKPKTDEMATAKKYRKLSAQSLGLSNTKVPAVETPVSQAVSTISSQVAASEQSPSSTNSLSNSADFSHSLALPSAVSTSTISATAIASSETPVTLKTRKDLEDSDVILIDEIGKKCTYCEYRCKSATDLRNHEMRHWVEKPFKCGHCDFETVREYEVKKHSAKVHPNKKVRVIQKQLPSTPEIKPVQRRKYLHKPEPPSDAADLTEISNAKIVNSELAQLSVNSKLNMSEDVHTESRKMFRCFYCPLRATSLEIVHKHWEKTHKARIMSTTGASKNGLPFRYKEVNMDDLLKGRDTSRKKKTNMYTCSHCNKKGTLSVITLHHKQNHPDKPMKIVGVVTQYECAECQFVALSSGTLKRHFESEHPGKEFRYMVHTTTQPAVLPDSKFLPSKEIPENTSRIPSLGGKTEVKESSASEVKLSPCVDKLVKYVCSWCSETCFSEAKMNFHHTMYHSHLEQKFSVENVFESTREKIKYFMCPKCSYKVPSFEQMGEHLRKHCRPFKCGYCSRLFEFPIHVRNHISVMHPDQPPKIISVKESESDLSALKAQVIVTEEEGELSSYTEVDLTSKGAVSDESEEPVKKKSVFGFARKSTSMKQRILHVARKSTNPAPYRYPVRIEGSMTSSDSGSSRADSPASLEEYSYYGQKVVPLDWKKIRTTVNYGGVHVQVNVASMSQIFNLNPVVLVKDLKTEWRPA